MNLFDYLGDLRVVAFLACVCSACSAVLRCLSAKPDRAAMIGRLGFVVLPEASSSHVKNYTCGP